MSPNRDRTHRSSHRSHSHSHPHSHSRHHHHRRPSLHRSEAKPAAPPEPLPFNAPPITKYDYHVLSRVFADYLDVQKGIDLDELDKAESRGRFKRFVKHYNRGDLARGWYERVVKNQSAPAPRRARDRPALPPPQKRVKRDTQQLSDESGDESEDDVVGPTLPGSERKRKAGAAVPTKVDLELQDEQAVEDAELRRLDLRHERKLDRKMQKEQLEELVPRAEPGTHERKMEKKRELNDKMRAFRDKSPDVEADESMLMGEDAGLEGYKQKKAAMERKKNERELRREQILRARIAEREERLQAHREKEESTMKLLHQLAARFQG